MKKKNIVLLSALLFSVSAIAQTEVTAGVTRGKDYGVTYVLPKTEIELTVQATKHTYTPGEFSKYAERYLRLNNVSSEPETYWTLDKMQTEVIGVPDKENVYFVKMKDKTVAPLIELSKDGIVYSINMPLGSGQRKTTPTIQPKVTGNTPNVNPRDFLTEEILIRKARAGLEVRVIYDAVGSWRLSRTTLRRMHDAGVRTAAFEPVRFPWFTTRVSRRNHRKIVVTDGRVAFLGGINIAKYYLDGDYMGKWRDEHLRIEGDAVKDLQRLFIADWARVTDECLDLRRYVAPHGIRQRLPIQLAWSEEGPSRLTIAEAFAAAVVRARQRVRICSPYFLPPTLILDALRLAARGGIRVEVMIPTCSDSPFSDLVSDSYVADLLDAGVELYRYDNGFLHAKLVIVDDTLASVGTANMDYRSLTDNLEVTAFIRDRETVRLLAATFDDDLASCRRITRAEWRPPLWRRTLGDVLRLVSPLM